MSEDNSIPSVEDDNNSSSIMEDEGSSLFNISTEPDEDANAERLLYFQECSAFLEEDAKPARKGRFCCFNCMSTSHIISECPQKVNRHLVNKNRAQFQLQRMQQQSSISNSKEFKRYHIVVGGIIKAEASPGVISDRLREALGISKCQLPPYIYKMRELGYPPGWLQEATLSHSGINMIDSNGERVPDPEEEEGEIYVVKTRYDFSKIIDFPGYNVWPSPDTINETEEYGAPQMEFAHSKKVFIDGLMKQMEDDEGMAAPEVVDMSIDMDTVEVESGVLVEGRGTFLPPLPAEASPPPPPPPPPEENPSDLSVNNSSEDEEEGEIIVKSDSSRKGSKRKLDDNADLPTVKSPRTSLLHDSLHSDAGDTTSLSENTEISSTEPNANQSLDSSFGRVISVELGTPALKIHSPFTNLPSAEAFRKDITDVINFENLPNSTGKYEKLKSLLKNVREKMSLFRSGN